jgi:hypothetical protein
MTVHRTSFAKIENQFTQKTTADLTYYVRTTGNDGNSGTNVDSPLLTIQEAVDRIPKFISHAVVIDIGEGDFAGVTLDSFTYSTANSLLSLNGTLGNPTLTTGTASGTADGGDTLTCVDSGQTWTVNELRGMLLKVGTEYRVVRNNDATTINLIGPYTATASGKAYELFEQKTAITSVGLNGEGGIEISGGQARQRQSSWIVQDIKISGVSGIYLRVGCPGLARRVAVIGGTFGFAFQSTSAGRPMMQDCYATNNYYGFFIGRLGAAQMYPEPDNTRWYSYAATNTGIYFANNAEVSWAYVDSSAGNGIAAEFMRVVTFKDHVTVEDSVGHGIALLYGVGYTTLRGVTLRNNGESGLFVGGDCGTVDIDGDSATIEDNGEYGIQINENASGKTTVRSFLVIGNAAIIQNNTLGGIIAKNHSIVALDDCTGTNTAGYGLELQTGSTATITGDTAITGADGDATINEGVTDLDWATDFASDGDKVVNPDNFCLIERKD